MNLRKLKNVDQQISNLGDCRMFNRGTTVEIGRIKRRVGKKSLIRFCRPLLFSPIANEAATSNCLYAVHELFGSSSQILTRSKLVFSLPFSRATFNVFVVCCAYSPFFPSSLCDLCHLSAIAYLKAEGRKGKIPIMAAYGLLLAIGT